MCHRATNQTHPLATPVNGPDRFTPVSVCNTGGWRPLVFVITYHNEVVYHCVELKGKHERQAKYGHDIPELETFSFLFPSRSCVTYVTAFIQLNVYHRKKVCLRHICAVAGKKLNPTFPCKAKRFRSHLLDSGHRTTWHPYDC